MGKNKVQITGINTNDLKVLSSEEMQKLFMEMHSGNQDAREILAEGNLKLVLAVLKNYSDSNNMDDLFQIGCVGLLKAIDNFDLSHEVKFSTYAVPMILGEVRRYLRDNSSLRISRSLKDIAYKALKYKDLYLAKYGKEASYEEISKELQVDIFDLTSALESLREPISMFEPIFSDGGDTIYLFDQIEDKSVNNSELAVKIALNDAINKLDERERHILDERFVIGKTQMEIASELAISQAQVSRLEQGAIKQLKKVLK